MGDYPCPRCGQPTSGSYSPGGLKWAICEACMDTDLTYQERTDKTRAAQNTQQIRDQVEYEASFDYPPEEEI